MGAPQRGIAFLLFSSLSVTCVDGDIDFDEVSTVEQAASSATKILVIDYNVGFNSDQAHQFGTPSSVFNHLNDNYTATRVNTLPPAIAKADFDQVWVFGEPSPRPATEEAVLSAYLADGGAVMFQTEVGCCNGSAAALESLMRAIVVDGSGIAHSRIVGGTLPAATALTDCDASVTFNAVRTFDSLPATVTQHYVNGTDIGSVIVTSTGLIGGAGALYGTGDYNAWFVGGSQAAGLTPNYIDQVVDLLANAPADVAVCTAAVCGDGVVGGGETCDDSNTDPGDGCDAACAVEPGFTCTGAPSACTTTCGDGIRAGTEACDDGNTDPGDGCDATCVVEPGFTCTGLTPDVCTTTCGDGARGGAEACDDGNNTAGDGCDDSCGVEEGFTCEGLNPDVCATTCGDGISAGAETCDDGNEDAADGCSEVCVVESGFSCTGSPSLCVSTCGDGVVAGNELCDDGNDLNGDGCSQFCTLESDDGGCCSTSSNPQGTIALTLFTIGMLLRRRRARR